MPYLKPKYAHTSCVGVMRYLEEKHRFIGRDFINCCNAPEHAHGWDWATQMDRTREAFGNNKNTNQYKTCTYVHFILSPDPTNGIELEALRNLATGWAARHFTDFQIAIVYHLDTDVPHAHIVVNNTNIVSGERLSPKLTKTFRKTIRDDLEALAKDQGLRIYRDRLDEQLERQWEIEERHGAVVIHNDDLAQSRRERELDRSEPSWKDEINRRVNEAYIRARFYPEFEQNCDLLGIGIDRMKDGELLFFMHDRPSRKVGAPRLNDALQVRELIRYFGPCEELGIPEMRESTQKEYRSKTEKSLLAEGKYSWKEDVRNRVTIAKSVSRSMKEFEIACNHLGLDVRTGRDGQFVFTFQDQPSRSVGSARLGSMYRMDAIRQSCITQYDKPISQDEIFAAIDQFRDAGTRVVAYVHPADKTTLRQLALTLDTLASRNVSNLEQLDRLRRQAQWLVRSQEKSVALQSAAHSQGVATVGSSNQPSEHRGLKRAQANYRSLDRVYDTAQRYNLIPDKGYRDSIMKPVIDRMKSDAERSRVVKARVERAIEREKMANRPKRASYQETQDHSGSSHDNRDVGRSQGRVR